MKYKIVRIKKGFYGYKTLQPFQWGLQFYVNGLKNGLGSLGNDNFALLGCYENLKDAQKSLWHCVKIDNYLKE